MTQKSQTTYLTHKSQNTNKTITLKKHIITKLKLFLPIKGIPIWRTQVTRSSWYFLCPWRLANSQSFVDFFKKSTVETHSEAHFKDSRILGRLSMADINLEKINKYNNIWVDKNESLNLPIINFGIIIIIFGARNINLTLQKEKFGKSYCRD